jgi:DNA polymerase-3 subunit epsilon
MMNIISEYVQKVSTLMKFGSKYASSINTWSGSVTQDTMIAECPFVVFDTELSGLNQHKDFIISIGAIKMIGGTIHLGKLFDRLIKPEGEMSGKNIVIHCLTPDELCEEDLIDNVMPGFLEFITDSVLMGHFIHIDLRFINRSLKRIYNTTLKNPAIDTYTLHEWLLQNGSEFKKHYRGASVNTDLFSVSERYGVTVNTAHNALNDAFITAQLFQRFIYFLDKIGVKTLKELIDIGRA